MIQRSDKGSQIRAYFIECEKKMLQVSVQPKTRLELAKENVLLIEEIERKDTLLLEQEPKVKAFNKVIDTTATFTVDSLSDSVDIGRNKLFALLREWGWVCKGTKSGTSATRYCEEQRYGRTIFETIEVNKKERQNKRFVLSRRGFELAINKITNLQPI